MRNPKVPACVPQDNQPHAILDGHHAPYCCKPPSPDSRGLLDSIRIADRLSRMAAGYFG